MENCIAPNIGKSSRYKKASKYCISYLITFIFIYFLCREINFTELYTSISKAKFAYIVLGFASLALGYLFRGFRWGLMLQRIEPNISRPKALTKFVYSMALNNLLPFRAGDIYRVFCFKDKASLTPAKVLGTLILERLLDLLMIASLFFITLKYIKVSIIPDYFFYFLQGLIFISLCLFILLLIIPNSIKALFKKISLSKFGKNKLIIKISDQVEHFIDAVNLMRSPGYIAYLILLSAMAWLLEGSLFLFSAYAMGYHGSILGPYFASTTGAISTVLPSAPGYIGTFDYFTMLGLKAYNATTAVATATALLTHLILWLPTVIFGLFYNLIQTHKKTRIS